jgi:UDPglucose 6-dehydrogenase
VGANSHEAIDTLRALYAPIIERSFPTELDPRPKVAVPFVTTDLASAEMIKYAANAFLATKVSFINEIANLCELVSADVRSVAQGIGLDERIGSRFLNAGIGWGGSCFVILATSRRTTWPFTTQSGKKKSAPSQILAFVNLSRNKVYAW